MTTDAEREMEEFIIKSPLSPSRLEELLQDFRRSREQCAGLNTVFRLAGCLQETADWNDDHAAGFNVLLHKGPLVDGSNWLSYRTWEFALGLERHLLHRFELSLLEAPTRDQTKLVWSDIIASIDSSMDELIAPSLIVISGRLPVDMMTELYREEYMTPDWRLPPERRSQWIIASHGAIPVLNIRESEHPAVYVIDLCRYAELIKHDDINYEFTQIDQKRAEEMAKQRPELYAGEGPIPKHIEDRIRELRLHVGLRLYESYELRPIDTSAVVRFGLPSSTAPPPASG